ncbi:dephospho-CoA kinase [Calidifontibacter sp. DB0510]|uniref:Dephospho-CoA kinase n=1 Tax=Metallococcus carri TaxID=1656884 RepID=A0A967E878_9MICO|nr:dephospho-CoA kinase [Metallococcus carri]NHN54932.1 dephospho-CoA kinase [Metallococcus carri]NOP37278.1 dephospho-CoA kinase [Calidifontibacter sp. DB2511S]
MLRIGLTGGIGAGKSTVSSRMAERGALIVDADLIAREVVAPGTPGLAAVVSRFGDGVLARDGALDRAALGRIVFSDKAARRDLEGITHPLIFAETVRRFEAARPDQVVVHDIPLLVELGREVDYPLTVIVAAAEEVRHTRLVRDRGMDSDEAWSRIRAQANDEQRLAAADVWLLNEGSPDDVIAAVDALWDNRIRPYDENLRSGRGVRRPSLAELVDYDPQWPAVADRLGRRIATQLRNAGFGELTVEHIGSTSVPGLAAKNVLDLQLLVPDLAVAEQDSFASGLLAAGFAEFRLNEDTPQPWATDPALWTKFSALGCDPGRVVHLHVRAADGPGAELARDFRDWLRANDDERAAYEVMKREVADAHPGGTEDTRGDYPEAKEPWFAENLPRAKAWADARRGG